MENAADGEILVAAKKRVRSPMSPPCAPGVSHRLYYFNSLHMENNGHILAAILSPVSMNFSTHPHFQVLQGHALHPITEEDPLSLLVANLLK